jgi:vacuolar-type H+-ATPase subunit I/STV1
MKVIVLKNDLESAWLFLGRKGIAQAIEVNLEAGEYCTVLEKNGDSCGVGCQILDLQTRSNRLIEKLDLKEEILTGEAFISEHKNVHDLIVEIETKLSTIEESSKPYVVALNTSSFLRKRIDQKLDALKIKRRKNRSQKSDFTALPTQEILKIEQKLTDIEQEYENTLRTSALCLNLLQKINRVSISSGVKIPIIPVESVTSLPDEKALGLLDQSVSATKSSTTNKDSIINELAPVKSTITKILEQIPKIQGALTRQLLEISDSLSMVRNAIKTNTEFGKFHFEIVSIQETLKEIDEIIKIQNQTGVCGPTAYFEAWVPKIKIEEISNELKELTKNKVIIEIEKPSDEEVAPTILKPAPRLLEAFEKLTFSLGYPRPDEINPVFIMAITFPLLFGIMFADVGQGAIILVAGLLLTLIKGRVDLKKVGEIPRYFLVASGLLIFCGISAIFFGFLFGDFFGPSGVLQPILLLTIGPFKIGGFDPLHEPLTLLRFAILIGIIILSIGLVLRVVNNIRENRFKPALISTFWLWLLLGGFSMWIYWGGISNLTLWFTDGLVMFAGLMGLPTLLIFIVSATSGGIMEGIDFSIEVLLETLDHTISFTRLAALFLTHAALNQMFLIIAGVENGIFTLQSIPILMLGTFLALSIEGLIIFVHTLRLHWIELLPEFYSGKGILFKPLKVK